MPPAAGALLRDLQKLPELKSMSLGKSLCDSGSAADIKDDNEGKTLIFKKAFQRPEDATVLVESGDKTWFNGQDLLVQFENAIEIAEKLHPGCDLLFVFDNASSHKAFAANALLVNKMNLGPGKVIGCNMRSGWYIDPQTKAVVEQPMVVNGQNIGVKQALVARGLWPSNGNLLLQCAKNKGGCSSIDFDCCAKNVLQNQPDFKEQKCALEELVDLHNKEWKTGHIVEFLPKFHPELNPIERFWAFLKRFLRNNCQYSMLKLRAGLPKAIWECAQPATIGKCFNTCFRFMSAYARNLSYTLASLATKQYRGHRCIPSDVSTEAILKEIEGQ